MVYLFTALAIGVMFTNWRITRIQNLMIKHGVLSKAEMWEHWSE